MKHDQLGLDEFKFDSESSLVKKRVIFIGNLFVNVRERIHPESSVD